MVPVREGMKEAVVWSRAEEVRGIARPACLSRTLSDGPVPQKGPRPEIMGRGRSERQLVQLPA